jgi:DnaJ-class molecular chaperone
MPGPWRSGEVAKWRSGEVAQEETLAMQIPVGVEEGLALRIPGKGMPSPDPGGVPGDLFAVVRTRPDAPFERVGRTCCDLKPYPLRMRFWARL